MLEICVVDASVLVPFLLSKSRNDLWILKHLKTKTLIAPQLLHVEVSDVLRRKQLANKIDRVTATQAYYELMDLPIKLYPFTPLAPRVWELRENLSLYDAWYVALAEEHGVPLLTLDRKLAKAPGIRCEVLTIKQ